MQAEADLLLRDRALSAADVSFSISDPKQPDNPLVWVNPAFTRVTGYGYEEAVGRNCRFLQGPDTDPAMVDELRTAIRSGRSVTVTLLNYRADGTPFWNEVAISPVRDERGELTHFVAVQTDVTERVEAERDRQAAQVRLSLLAEASTLLTATLDVGEALDRLARLTVPLLADWCAVDLVEDSGEAAQVAIASADPDAAELVRMAEQVLPRHRNPGSISAQVLSTGEAILVPEVTEERLVAMARTDEQLAFYLKLESRSALAVPLRARRQVLGVLTLVATSVSERRFTERDLELAKDLARRAALAVDNARLYTREHRMAEALQLSLLPALPEVPGLAVAARYLAAGQNTQVGGDWYDVLPLPDGATALAIGDVMGHDLSAAASMGQLQSVLRSYAWEGGAPGVVLDRLDRLVQGLEMAQLATAVFARLEPRASGNLLRYANAGHLPPLLRTADGSARYLEDGRSVLLGASIDGHRAEATEPLAPGSTLLLYTDGLVERRRRGIDEGLDWLRDVVVATDPAADPEALCDAVLAALGSAPLDDDVALLAVRT